MKTKSELHPKKIRLIICDIDGTLLPRGVMELSQKNRDAFQSAHEQGLKVMINTGRHYTFIQPSLLKTIHADLIGTINGACLNKMDGTILKCFPMSEEMMNRLIDAGDRYHLGIGFKFRNGIYSYCNHDFYLSNYTAPGSRERSLVQNGCISRDHHKTAGTPLGTFLIMPDPTLLPVLQSEFPEMVFAKSTVNGFDVFPSGTDKTTAAGAALEYYGLNWENVIAFGDAGNDLSLIQKAGIGVFMGNTSSDLKPYADLVAPDCKEDGVAAVLKQLNLV